MKDTRAQKMKGLCLQHGGTRRCFFFLKAFAFLKRALKNSDLGKCRVIIVQRIVKSLSKALKKPQQKPLHVA
jgi:hypothetical protein